MHPTHHGADIGDHHDPSKPVAFVAAPISSTLDNPAISASTISVVGKILAACTKTGYSIENARDAEDWGRPVKPPGEGFGEIFSALQRSTVVVAYLGKPFSLGVQVELGIAYALGKPLVVLIDGDLEVPYMVRGLAEIDSAVVIPFSDLNTLERQLEDSLANRIPQSRP
jgi:hypothetical protein